MARFWPRPLADLRIPLYSAFWALSLAITVNDNFLEITNINGSSMSPTLSPHFDSTRQKDFVAWRKRQPTRGLARGDVVHFANPADPESFAVKRVIALEGDTVLLDARRRPSKAGYVCSGATETVNWGDCVEGHAWDAWKGKVVVPAEHVWVEGDNWAKSRDSNWYGPISRSLITGKAIAVVLPFERWGSRPWTGFQSRTRVIPARPQEDGLDELLEMQKR